MIFLLLHFIQKIVKAERKSEQIFALTAAHEWTERETAMRLIDVDALRADYGMAEDCKDCKTGYRSCEYDRIYSKMDFCGWLDDAPPVDAVPVRHGRWIDKSGGIEGAWNYCSVCGEQAIDLYDFCPNCGADMRKDGEHDS